MADINRSQFLPAEIAKDIIAKTQTNSAVMALARQITLPGTGIAIPVITGDPTAAWVGETAKKPVSNSSVESKLMQPYKLAVIETFSQELLRDASALYDALAQRLPGALAKVFDSTVLGATAKPGSNFDNFASATQQVLTASTAYAAVTDAEADIAANGGILDGFAFSPAGKSVLLKAVDDNKRPLFINNVSEGAVPMVLGAKTVLSKGMAGTVGSKTAIGVAGDWTQAIYGTVEGIKIAVSDQATVGDVNLWEQNMVAIRAEIEVGFVADTTAFNVFVTE